MCDLDGESVFLGVGFEVSDAQTRPSVTLSSRYILIDPDVELSAMSLASYLPTCYYTSHHDINGPLNL